MEQKLFIGNKSFSQKISKRQLSDKQNFDKVNKAPQTENRKGWFDYRFCGTEEKASRHIHCNWKALSNVKSQILGTDFIQEPCVKAKNTRNFLQFWIKEIE